MLGVKRLCLVYAVLPVNFGMQMQSGCFGLMIQFWNTPQSLDQQYPDIDV